MSEYQSLQKACVKLHDNHGSWKAVGEWLYAEAAGKPGVRKSTPGSLAALASEVARGARDSSNTLASYIREAKPGTIKPKRTYDHLLKINRYDMRSAARTLYTHLTEQQIDELVENVWLLMGR